MSDFARQFQEACEGLTVADLDYLTDLAAGGSLKEVAIAHGRVERTVYRARNGETVKYAHPLGLLRQHRIEALIEQVERVKHLVLAHLIDSLEATTVDGSVDVYRRNWATELLARSPLLMPDPPEGPQEAVGQADPHDWSGHRSSGDSVDDVSDE